MKKNIKVMHFVIGLGVGGVEQMLLKTLPLMSKNIENIVYSINPGEIGDKLAKLGIKIIYCPKVNIFSLVSDFKKVVKHEKPDLLITYLMHADLFGRFFGRLFGVKKIICSKRGILLNYEYLKYFDKLSSFLVDKYICVSKTLQKRLVNNWHIPEKKVITIPNGVNINIFNQIKLDKTKMLATFKIPKGTLIFTYTANLRDQKGHIELVKALNLVNKKLKKWTLLLIGADQGEKNKIVNTIKHYKLEKNIILLGYRDDVLKILKITDIFLFPSLGEGMSNALLEAMASGCPIIANDIPENRELIKHNKNGLLAQIGNYSFSRKIIVLSRNSILRKKLASKARETAQKQFNVNKIVKEIETQYFQVINE